MYESYTIINLIYRGFFSEKYIVLDNGMVPMLKRYRKDGMKLFLLTNSFWEHTSTAMNYL
jgi:hypothetical protein